MKHRALAIVYEIEQCFIEFLNSVIVSKHNGDFEDEAIQTSDWIAWGVFGWELWRGGLGAEIRLSLGSSRPTVFGRL